MNHLKVKCIYLLWREEMTTPEEEKKTNDDSFLIQLDSSHIDEESTVFIFIRLHSRLQFCRNSKLPTNTISISHSGFILIADSLVAIGPTRGANWAPAWASLGKLTAMEPENRENEIEKSNREPVKKEMKEREKQGGREKGEEEERERWWSKHQERSADTSVYLQVTVYTSVFRKSLILLSLTLYIPLNLNFCPLFFPPCQLFITMIHSLQ